MTLYIRKRSKRCRCSCGSMINEPHSLIYYRNVKARLLQTVCAYCIDTRLPLWLIPGKDRYVVDRATVDVASKVRGKLAAEGRLDMVL